MIAVSPLVGSARNLSIAVDELVDLGAERFDIGVRAGLLATRRIRGVARGLGVGWGVGLGVGGRVAVVVGAARGSEQNERQDGDGDDPERLVAQ